MVHKRYVWKKGKLHGPYLYESYRDKAGKVKKRYLGKAEEKNKKKIVVSLLIFFILIGIIGFTIFNQEFSFEGFPDFVEQLFGIGRVGLNIEEVYELEEPITREVSLDIGSKKSFFNNFLYWVFETGITSKVINDPLPSDESIESFFRNMINLLLPKLWFPTGADIEMFGADTEGTVMEGWVMAGRFANHSSYHGDKAPSWLDDTNVSVFDASYPVREVVVSEGYVYAIAEDTLYRLRAYLTETEEALQEIDSISLPDSGYVGLKYVSVTEDYVYVVGDDKIYQLNIGDLSVFAEFDLLGGVNGFTVFEDYVYVLTTDNANTHYLYQLLSSDVSQKFDEYATGFFAYADVIPMVFIPDSELGQAYVYFGFEVWNSDINDFEQHVVQLNAGAISNEISRFSIVDSINRFSNVVAYGDFVYVGFGSTFYQLNASDVSNVFSQFSVTGAEFGMSAIGKDFVYVADSNNFNLHQLYASDVSIEFARQSGFTFDPEFLNTPAINEDYVYLTVSSADGTDWLDIFQFDSNDIRNEISHYEFITEGGTPKIISSGFQGVLSYHRLYIPAGNFYNCYDVGDPCYGAIYSFGEPIIPVVCGDGVLEPEGQDRILGTVDDEECDDGNLEREDGCNETCKLEDCGDRIVQERLGEECEVDEDLGPGCVGRIPITFCSFAGVANCDLYYSTDVSGDRRCEVEVDEFSSRCAEGWECNPEPYVCSQEEFICDGPKLGVRDNLGECVGCFCVEDEYVYSCVKDSCGAQCAVAEDCDDIEGLTKSCNLDTCGCEYDVETVCGDGVIQAPNDAGIMEECDPLGIESPWCEQTETECLGPKSGVRYWLGDCGINCLCVETEFDYNCDINAPCGAECDSNDDCVAGADGICNLDDCACTYAMTYCGDGIVQQPNSDGFNESCDDGINGIDTDLCNDTCEFTICGDGIVQKPNGLGVNEQCDLTDLNGSTSCTEIFPGTVGTLGCDSACHYNGCTTPPSNGNGGNGKKPKCKWVSEISGCAPCNFEEFPQECTDYSALGIYNVTYNSSQKVNASSDRYSVDHCHGTKSEIYEPCPEVCIEEILVDTGWQNNCSSDGYFHRFILLNCEGGKVLSKPCGDCSILISDGLNLISICEWLEDYSFASVLRSGMGVDYEKIEYIVEYDPYQERYRWWNKNDTQEFYEFNWSKSYFIYYDDGSSKIIEPDGLLYGNVDLLNIFSGFKGPFYPYEFNSGEIPVEGSSFEETFYDLPFIYIVDYNRVRQSYRWTLYSEEKGTREVDKIKTGDGFFIYGDSGELHYTPPEERSGDVMNVIDVTGRVVAGVDDFIVENSKLAGVVFIFVIFVVVLIARRYRNA